MVVESIKTLIKAIQIIAIIAICILLLDIAFGLLLSPENYIGIEMVCNNTFDFLVGVFIALFCILFLNVARLIVVGFALVNSALKRVESKLKSDE